LERIAFCLYHKSKDEEKMTRSTIILCAVLLLGTMALIAQGGEWEYFSYGGQIRSFAHHADDVWIGTTTGLVRYDTITQLKQFINKSNSPLSNNLILSVAVSPSGILWIGTSKGLYRVEGENWQYFDSQNSGLPTNAAREIFCLSDTELWLLMGNNGGNDYACHYVGGTFVPYSAGSDPIWGQVIRGMALDQQGVPWLGWYNTSNGTFGISHFADSFWISQSMSDLGLPNQDIFGLAHDGSRLWLGTGTGQLFSIDSGGAQIHDLTQPPYNMHVVTDMAVDSQNRLLAAFRAWDGKGYLLRRQGDGWELLDPNQVPHLNSTRAIMEDATGRIWLGTGGGVAIHDGTSWSAFDCSNSPLPTNNLGCLTIDHQGDLWMSLHDFQGGTSALAKKSGDNWTFMYSTEYSYLRNPHELAFSPDGTMWFRDNYFGGIVSFDGTNWTRYHLIFQNLPEGTLNLLRLDGNGIPWITISSQDYQTRVYRLEQGAWAEKAVLLPGVLDMAFDGVNNAWLATTGGLVYLGDSTEIYNTQNSGLTNNQVQCLAIGADRKLWIGTSSGLCSYLNGVWETWDISHGNHPFRCFLDLVAAPDGRVWGATQNTGLVCFDGTEFSVFMENNSPLTYNRIKELELDPQGNLWMDSLGQGIIRFHPSTTSANDPAQVPPQLPCLSNFPNPFNPSTTIRFTLPESGPASLGIYNLRGQLVRELCSSNLKDGEHSYVWDGRDSRGNDVSSGVYFARLKTGTNSRSHKLLLMK
jgi:ligand-binding sensor domain-containing protein